MELATTPMTERQRKYRENYRKRVAGWSNGRLHILLIYTIGLTVLHAWEILLEDNRRYHSISHGWAH